MILQLAFTTMGKGKNEGNSGAFRKLWNCLQYFLGATLHVCCLLMHLPYMQFSICCNSQFETFFQQCFKTKNTHLKVQLYIYYDLLYIYYYTNAVSFLDFCSLCFW
jgi:hypothetical protein